MDAKARFWAKVNKTDDCWLWTGAITSGGYGNFAVSAVRKTESFNSPHRVLWEWMHGPIPAGHQIDHACHNPRTCPGGSACQHRRCVNPAHLQLATPKQNSGAGRTVQASSSAVECKNGHLRAGNTYRTPAGKQVCRKCQVKAVARYRAKKRNMPS